MVKSIGERAQWPYVPGKRLTEPFVGVSNNDVMPFFLTIESPGTFLERVSDILDEEKESPLKDVFLIFHSHQIKYLVYPN